MDLFVEVVGELNFDSTGRSRGVRSGCLIGFGLALGDGSLRRNTDGFALAVVGRRFFECVDRLIVVEFVGLEDDIVHNVALSLHLVDFFVAVVVADTVDVDSFLFVGLGFRAENLDCFG